MKLRNKKTFTLILFCLMIGVVYILFNQSKNRTLNKNTNTYTNQINNITIPAQIGKEYFQVFDEKKMPYDLLLKGVNLGIANPGHFPGETAITKVEYLRWFKEIGKMNANVIRVYTIHPPAFYDALSEYNQKAKRPLYLIHGVWINEEMLNSLGDIYNKSLTKEFQDEIYQTVDIIHGKANILQKPGHASGKYHSNISKYVIGWILGIEWDPNMMKSTNDKHKGNVVFNGQYFQTNNATPFENWLASILDNTVKYESEKYSWQRPISFANWVTTDPIHHPNEPMENEDLVSLDPNHVSAKSSLYPGYFASYHVYPYYPEFLNYELAYTNYIDSRGKKNSYAGYLHNLRNVHNMPVLISEFGVPSSRGMTHRNRYGWNQGFHNETQQGKIVTHLFEDIQTEGMAGGIVFSWQDEWFKRTWNNMELDDPDRRPFWSNVQTSEQQFGLLSFDPNSSKKAISVDGDSSDWKKNKIKSANMKNANFIKPLDQNDTERKLKNWSITSDARSIYFLLNFEKTKQPFDWAKTGVMILLDTIPGQGQHQLPNDNSVKSKNGIDFVIELNGPNNSHVLVDSYYDPFYYEYANLLHYAPIEPNVNKKDNGLYHKVMLGLNRPLVIPNYNGKSLNLPLEFYETGKLKFGDGNPNHKNFNSLTDVSLNEKDHVLEIRIPWQLLNVRDPSTREIMGDLWKGGLKSQKYVKKIHVAILTYRPNGSNKDLSYSTVRQKNGNLKKGDFFSYTWKKWDLPVYHERLKQSYYILKDTFHKAEINK
ncbi:hypothetical protein [Bacillus sp. AFS017336]|uniref:hypothetical protein n=1 Tax=Bacillus sp. AFS017336 TaxID=2033489 RepID=UPI000BF0D210|nr:hypothetical protein [Bacillus sp. AFS017336]PEK99036.1 hypothetical protein CN601_24315 [Bacillus sp. AFS017336]